MPPTTRAWTRRTSGRTKQGSGKDAGLRPRGHEELRSGRRTETERQWRHRGWGGGCGLAGSGCGVSIWEEEEKSPGAGEGWQHVGALSAAELSPKMVKTVNFMLRLFYHDWKRNTSARGSGLPSRGERPGKEGEASPRAPSICRPQCRLQKPKGHPGSRSPAVTVSAQRPRPVLRMQRCDSRVLRKLPAAATLQRCDAGAGRSDFPCSTLGCDPGRGGTHPSGESGFPDKSQGSWEHPEREGTRRSPAVGPQARARRRRPAARGPRGPTHTPPRKLGLGGAQSPCLGGSYSKR